MADDFEARAVLGRGQDARLLDFPSPWLGPLLLCLSFFCAAFLTWQRIGDVLHDFGIQLYTPWLLSRGEALYRDIFWIYGPLSQNFNALLFQLQGYASVRIIEAADLVIAFLFGASTYVFLLRRTDRFTAFVAVLAYFTLGVFQHLTSVGNFSFLFPYAHEATHGSALIGAAVVLLAETSRQPFWRRFISGLLLGLAVLTKVEIAATALALFAFVGLALIRQSRRGELFAILAGLVTPLVAAFLYFSLRFGFSAQDSFAATFGAFTPIWQGGMALVRERLNYDASPYGGAGNLVTCLKFGLLLLGLVCAMLLADFAVAKRQVSRSSVLSVGALIGASFLYFVQELPWLDVARGIPLLCVALLLAARSLRFDWVLWGIFAVGFALRLGPQFRFEHYGFFMAMPLMLALVAQLLHVLPHRLRFSYGGGETFRWLALLGLIVYIAPIALYSAQNFALRTAPIGEGEDRTYAFPPSVSLETQIVNEALPLLREMLSSREDPSVLVLQNGSAINYLLKVPNRTHFVWFSNETALLGQEPLLQADLAAHPPDAILLILPPNQRDWPRWPAAIDELLQGKYGLVREWGREGVVGGRGYGF